jgi:hypothetical protein
MSDAPSFVRTTISIPRDLKERMDDEGGGENWSGVAKHAFEKRLLELKSQEKGASMEAIAERLRAADALDDNLQYKRGREAGEAWVKEDATPRQLRRLARFPEEEKRWPAGWAGWRAKVKEWNSPKCVGVAACLAYTIGVNNGSLSSDAENAAQAAFREGVHAESLQGIPAAMALAEKAGVTAFWEAILYEGGEDDFKDDSFALGFIEGALELWAKVKALV